MDKNYYYLLREKHWQMLKQQYPIGRKFWGKVWKVEPFGLLIEVDDFPKESYKHTVGVIDVGHEIFFKKNAYSWVHKEGYTELDRDDQTLWPQKGDYIFCAVCYYRDYTTSGQLGLAWLGR